MVIGQFLVKKEFNIFLGGPPLLTPSKKSNHPIENWNEKDLGEAS